MRMIISTTCTAECSEVYVYNSHSSHNSHIRLIF
ncbi:unnamed protein product [Arabidopsis halleri]